MPAEIGCGRTALDVENSVRIANFLQINAADKKATVTFTVKNTGSRDGAEVAQLYVKQEKLNLPRLSLFYMSQA